MKEEAAEKGALRTRKRPGRAGRQETSESVGGSSERLAQLFNQSCGRSRLNGGGLFPFALVISLGGLDFTGEAILKFVRKPYFAFGVKSVVVVTESNVPVEEVTRRVALLH